MAKDRGRNAGGGALAKRRLAGGAAPNDGEGKVEAFVAKLAKALGRIDADTGGLKTVEDVREALASAVDALPSNKPLKSQLQGDLERYALLLAAELGVPVKQQKPAAPERPAKKQKAAAKGKGRVPPARCSLVLDSNFQRQVEESDLGALDRGALTSLLIARPPATADLLRSYFGPTCDGAAGVLQASVRFLGAFPGAAGKRGRLLQAAAELAAEAADAQEKLDTAQLKQLSRTLDQLFAALSAQRWRQRVEYDEDDEGEDEDDKEQCGGDLVLLRAALRAAVLDGEDDGQKASLAGNIGADLAIVGPSAWLRVAEALLEPSLPLKISLSRALEDLLWQAAYDGLAVTAGTVLTPTEPSMGRLDVVRLYLTRIIISKRAAARRRGGPVSAKAQPKASVGPPPAEFCAWLRTQPLNSAVKAAVAILDRHQPADLTAHLMREEEKVVLLLLKSWRSDAEASAADGEREDTDDEAGQDAAGMQMQDDALFFVDTSGETQSHFGRSWAREEAEDDDEEEDEEEEESDDEEEEDDDGEEAGDDNDDDDEEEGDSDA